MKKLPEGLVYAKEHICCSDYNKCGSGSLVDLIETIGEKTLNRKVSVAEIYIVHKGHIEVTVDGKYKMDVKKGTLFVIPPHHQLSLKCYDSCIIVMKLNEDILFCENVDIGLLRQYPQPQAGPVICLPFNELIGYFVNGFLPFLRLGLRCKHFLNGKIREFLFCLRVCYTLQEQAMLFLPLLDDDVIFQGRIYSNLRSDITKDELVKVCGMSKSWFEKTFRKNFGTSPGMFIQEYRTRMIEHELRLGQKPLKILYSEFGFSHPSAFTRFCINHIGQSPSALRKSGKEKSQITLKEKSITKRGKTG